MKAATTQTRILKGDRVIIQAKKDMWRRLTEAEQIAWHNSDASKGMTCAGETKLCPRDVYNRKPVGEFVVVRGRVSAPRGYGKVSGCIQVRDSQGVLWYVGKHSVAVV